VIAHCDLLELGAQLREPGRRGVDRKCLQPLVEAYRNQEADREQQPAEQDLASFAGLHQPPAPGDKASRDKSPMAMSGVRGEAPELLFDPVADWSTCVLLGRRVGTRSSVPTAMRRTADTRRNTPESRPAANPTVATKRSKSFV
jgi:hypothetical protein